MDFPFGHHHHHRSRRDDDDQPEPYPPPPPPSADPPFFPPPIHGGSPYDQPSPPYNPNFSPYDQPPPPPPHNFAAYDQPLPPHRPAEVISHHHSSFDSQNYPPTSGYVQHISHEYNQPDEYTAEGHRLRPHMPAFIQTHIHSHVSADQGFDLGADNRPSYKVYCEAGGSNYLLAIRDRKVVLARSDPSDPTQYWIKDEKWSTKVKDEDGYPSFSLVNKATGLVLKHSAGAGHPVQLIPYNPDTFDESILWTESKNLGDGFRAIRMVNNVRLSIDAFHGDKDHGGVHDGTTIVLYECWKGDNQKWKIVPY